MQSDALFLATLEDLAGRVDRPLTEYEALMSSPLLRKLLLDSPTLSDVVNRERRVKVEYLANVKDPVWKIVGGPPPVAYAVEDGLDPATAARAEPAMVNRDRLLSLMVAVYRRQEIICPRLGSLCGQQRWGCPFRSAHGGVRESSRGAGRADACRRLSSRRANTSRARSGGCSSAGAAAGTSHR